MKEGNNPMKSHSGVPALPYRALRDSIRDARADAYLYVHHVMAGAFRNIGRLIMVEEQALRNRAGYGTHLPEDPGARLTGAYGRRFSVVTSGNILRFSLVIPRDLTRERFRMMRLAAQCGAN
jgi:hypothetical protein